MSKKYGYIYQIENLVNGKKYIGQTTNRKGHRSFPSGYKANNHLYCSYEKYGIENFKITVIDSTKNQKQLDKKEEFYIKKFNTLDCNFGYNLKHGGSRGKLIRFIFSKNYLKFEYIDLNKPISQIALEQNCNEYLIKFNLIKHNIPRKNRSEAHIKLNFSKKFLKQEYIVNKKTTRQIALENNCSFTTILLNLKKYNIPIR